MANIERTNEIIKEELAGLLNKNIDFRNGLITVTYVRCSEDYNYATVGISVLPDKLAGTALKILRASSGSLAKELNNKIRIRKVPKLSWKLDTIEREAEKIENIIKEDREEIEKIKEE
jgi:ribosome-binding factor A